MKRILFALLATVAGLVLVLSYRTSLDPTGGVPAALTSPKTSSPSPAAPPTGTGSGTTTTTPGLKDGNYLGAAANTRYGQVQVSIAVSGGSITDVTVPVYPSAGTREQRISSDAIPQLVSETLTAQSANIDMVSGATYTIQGYLESLQSAIDQARA